MSSPRGDFSFYPETGWAQTPLYLTTLRGGLFHLLPEPHTEVLPETVAANDLAFTALDTPLRSGWLNPYLFV